MSPKLLVLYIVVASEVIKYTVVSRIDVKAEVERAPVKGYLQETERHRCAGLVCYRMTFNVNMRAYADAVYLPSLSHRSIC